MSSRFLQRIVVGPVKVSKTVTRHECFPEWLVFAGVLTAACSSRAAPVQRAEAAAPTGAQATPAATRPIPPGDYDSRKQALERQIAALRAQASADASPATSVADIGRLLHGDPNACWAFIRSALRYEPYVGVLRGSEGTLQAGGGNSADLALLLRDLVRAGNPAAQTRFIIGDLAAEQAHALAARTLVEGPAHAAIAAAPGTAVSAAAPALPPGHRDDLSRQTRDANAVLADANADREQLRPMIAAIASPPAVDSVARSTRHVWLQVRSGASWKSFDPTGSYAPPGGVEPIDELPASIFHTVSIGVEIERISNGSLVKETAVQQAWPAATLAGKAVEVTLLPDPLPFDHLINPDHPNALLQQAREFRRFTVAVTTTGGGAEAAAGFGLDGKIIRDGGSSGGFAFNPFGGFGRPGGAPAAAADQLSGVWLTINITSPGAAPLSIRRPLLDRIGQAPRQNPPISIAPDWRDEARVSLGLIGRHQILVSTGPVGLERVAADVLDSITKGDVLGHAMAIAYRKDTRPPEAAVADLALPEMPAALVMINDVALSAASASLAGRGIAYVAAPNVIIRSETMAPDARGQVHPASGIDIALDRIEAIGGAADVESARLLHGLFASELEQPALANARQAQTTSAAQVLRAAALQHIPLRMLRTDSDAGIVQAPADARAVMRAEIAAGAVLLVPAQPVTVANHTATAWWRVDRDGSVLAIGADGRGQASSEGVMVLNHISIPMVKKAMRFTACFDVAMGGGGSMDEAGADCLADQVEDIVKEALDDSIDEFVKDPLSDKLKEAALGEDYEELYAKAEKAWDIYTKAQDAIEDPQGTAESSVPGGNEGKDAAAGGRRIGSVFGFRLYLLLTMGRDIAAYATRH